MTDYTITTDFGAKDSLPSGNAAKVIKGSEFTTEFTNIKTAVNSKADSAGDTFTGAVTFDAAVTLNADVTFDTNTMFVDVSENKVGIGNVAPATALDVTGVITTDGLTSSAGIDITGTVTASGLTVDTNTLHVDSSNNRVGIGTTNPATSLHVLNASDTQIRLSQTGEGSYDLGVIDGDKFAINRDGLTNEFVMSAGKVGIGTDDPQDALHINSDTTDARILLDGHTNFDAELKFAENGSIKYTVGHDAATDSFRIGTTNVDTNPRLVIDSSGNLLVGTTAVNPGLGNTNEGHSLNASGTAVHSADGNNALRVNRNSSDGTVVTISKDGSTVGTIGNDTNNLVIDVPNNGNALIFEGSNTSGTTTRLAITNAGGSEAFRPFNSDSDDLFDLGSSTRRFKDIYATNGTIQTSDRNEKQGIRELLDAEQRVATACKGLLRAFKWNSAVEAKGDEARIHFGIIAQDLQDAFTAEGLDAGDYAMFINSTETDEETDEERSRMGVRYSELLAFIISAI